MAFFLLFLVPCDKGCEEASPGDSKLKSTLETIYYYDFQDNDGATINEIDFPISVKDGILEFKSAEDFTKASVAIDNSTDEMIKFWATSIGFQSEYVEYIDILDRFEALEDNDSNFSKEFSSTELDKYKIILDDDAFWVKPRFDSRSTASLLNKEGLVIINDALNYFSDDFHILVIDGNKEKLNTAIQNESAIGLANVIYTQQKPENLNKTNNKLINCPSGGIAHRETIGKHRLIVEFFTYTFPVNFSTNLVTYNWTVRGQLHNRRKQGGSWRRTWTNLKFELISPILYVATLTSTPLPISITTIPVFTAVTGYPFGLLFSGGFVEDYVQRADTDKLLLSRSDVFFDTSLFRFNQSGFIFMGQIRGSRTSGPASETTPQPRLNITVGCN